MVNNVRKYLACLGVLVIAGPLAMAQGAPTAKQTQEANLQAYIDMLRKDLKAGKVATLTELMALSPEDAAKFWPVYNEFDKSLTKLADERIALIRLYSDSYPDIGEEVATKIATGMLDIEARRVELTKQYFQRLSKTLTAKDAIRWLQIEAQIGKLVDLQILSSLPIAE